MPPKARVATLVPIRNMDRAVRFYTKTLGGELQMRGEGEMKDGFASIMLAGHEIWLIAPDSREKRSLAYTSFLTKDIRGFVAGLVDRGVKFEKAERPGPEGRIEGPIAYTSYGATAYFKDPEGNLWMVFQA